MQRRGGPCGDGGEVEGSWASVGFYFVDEGEAAIEGAGGIGGGDEGGVAFDVDVIEILLGRRRESI